jgi:hypothetical protein
VKQVALLVVFVVSLAGVPTSGATKSAPPFGVLLARHLPLLVLHPAARFRPVPVDGFLADSDPMRPIGAGWEKVDAPLPVGGAEYRLDQRSCRAIEGPTATECYASTEAAHGTGAVVYGAAFRSQGRIALQYWLWYRTTSTARPSRRVSCGRCTRATGSPCR